MVRFLNDSDQKPIGKTSTNNGNHSFRCISCVHHPTFHVPGCFQASSMASWPKAAHPLEGYAISSVVWMDPNKPHLSEISDLYELCDIYIYRYKYSYTSTCLSFHIVSIYLLYFQKKYVSLRDKWELITSFPLTCSYLHHADNRLSLSKFKASKAIVTKAGSFGGIISLANNTRCHQGNMNGEAIGMQVWH